MLGFLVNTFPDTSETIALKEVLELQNVPFGMTIFSIQQPTDNKFHSAFNSVTVKVNYLSKNYWLQRSIIKMHFMFIFKHLRPYLDTLEFTLTRPEGGSFGQFCQAVYFSYLVQEKDIRHIHAHSANETSGLAELVSRLCGVSYSISVNAKNIYLQNPTILQRKISQAQFVTTYTESTRCFLQSINNSDTSIYGVIPSLDLANVLTETKITQTRPNVMRILSVGRLCKKKGFPTLISVCRLLIQAGYKFHCDVVCYDPEKEQLAGLIERYQLKETVRLLEQLVHNEQPYLYMKTAIFALPCQIADDSIPNVLIDAMSFGIPVMSTDISGIPELIENNQTGIVIEAKNYHALFTPFQRSLDNPNLFKQSGEAEWNCVTNNFPVDQHINNLRYLLNHTLQKKNNTHFPA